MDLEPTLHASRLLARLVFNNKAGTSRSSPPHCYEKCINEGLLLLTFYGSLGFSSSFGFSGFFSFSVFSGFSAFTEATKAARSASR